MDLLQQYGSDSEEEINSSSSSSSSSSPALRKKRTYSELNHSTAPSIEKKVLKTPMIAATSLALDIAPPVDVILPNTLSAFSPASVSSSSSSSSSSHDWSLAGRAEKFAMDDHIFDKNYHSFISRGVAFNPSAPLNSDPSLQYVHRTYTSSSLSSSSTATLVGLKIPKKSSSSATQAKNDPSNVAEFLGPWAPKHESKHFEITAEQKANQEEWEKKQALKKARKEEEEKSRANRWAETDENLAGNEGKAEMGETSTLHISSAYDYQGRSFLHSPVGFSHLQTPEKCYLPKTLLHTFVGHTKGINVIRLFPKTGHLLFSASLDSTVKVWRMGGNEMNDKDFSCIRTYQGHSEGIRDMVLTSTGSHFYTASYDKYVKYWDVETGQCIWRSSTNRIPYCVKCFPTEEKSNEILVGQGNAKIIQWDIRLNKMVQRYEEHLSAVNTLTFINDNKQFVSTSDDKKMFIWEYGIPVVVKHIADPNMHSMPSVAVHPTGTAYVAQSMDNQVLLVDLSRGFHLSRRKRFVGHLCAGYSCEVAFSPVGDYLMSGDAQGRAFFWDWKTRKMLKKMKVHNEVTTTLQWHPKMTSRIVTASWDGTIKYWD